MNQVTFQGESVNISGSIPSVGEKAPNFCLTASDLSEITQSSFSGKNLIINIFPSIDTPVCANSVIRFNEEASKLPDTKVLCVSADLPFAVSRFFKLEGIKNVQHASTFRNGDFSEKYGVSIPDGALRGLTTRAIICINKEGIVVHNELVAEITEEPNYDAAISSMR